MSKGKKKLVSDAAEVFVDAAERARESNLKRRKAGAAAKRKTKAKAKSRTEQVAAAKDRFECLSKYEILNDLDDLRKRAALDGSYKASLDISKFLLEELDRVPVKRSTQSREDLLKEQRERFETN